jgi:hypothetical protein
MATVSPLARPQPATRSFEFALATSRDDEAVRRLLRTPLPGRIALSFEREPDAAMAAAVEGDVHLTLLARDARTGDVAGMACRSERALFVNGRPRTMGYLGQLRVASGRRLRSLIDEGFGVLHELHRTGRTPAYLVSLVDDNAAARRLLVERRSPAAPAFTEVGRLTTFTLPARGRWRGGRPTGGALSEIRLAPGNDARLDEIASCLRRNLARYQFAPAWEAGDLRSAIRTRGLAASDFVVAMQGGRMVGCAALWDQRAFKQVVVRGYAGWLGRVRPFVNLFGPLVGAPRLPPVGESLAFAFVSHLAVDDDRVDVAVALVDAARSRARQAGLDCVVTAAPAAHGVAGAIRARWRAREYASTLYLASWPDGDDVVRALDGRPAWPEVAVL